MSRPHKPIPVMPFVGIIADGKIDRAILTEMNLGNPLVERPPIPFRWTDYYQPEMGDDLLRSWIFFDRLIDPTEIVELKHKSRDIEDRLSNNNHRTVNIDPGYIAPSHLVLSTYKDFSHRIYVGDSVYCEVTLQFRGGIWRPEAWTFADYRDAENQEFFTDARDIYMKMLRDRDEI